MQILYNFDKDNTKEKIIGIWGYPDPEVLKEVKEKYPNHRILDLDIPYNAPSTGMIPDAYCRIIRNIMDNSFAYKDRLELIVASVGREKCDSGHFAAKILKDKGFKVIETLHESYSELAKETPICQSDLPLVKKITKVMDGLIEKQNLLLNPIDAKFGFWGVPPNDLDFLDIFPRQTHVFGWVRCVEARRPADLELEMYVDEGLPTVFFAQTFCAKMQLAKYLAKKHDGLYIDVDDIATNSVKAKVEAFIKLR